MKSLEKEISAVIAQVLLADVSGAFNALTAVFSGLALAVSLYVAWLSHLRPFRPIFLVEGPTIRFFHFDRKVGTTSKTLKVEVWEPIVNCGITVFNSGVRPGQIVDYRLTFSSDRLTFAVYPSFAADPEKLRMVLADKAIGVKHSGELQIKARAAKWCGVIISEKSEVTQHLVFESGLLGLRSVPIGQFRVILEYCVGGDARWVHIASYELDVDEWMRGQLEAGDSFAFGITQADRKWLKHWRDSDRLILDDEVERQLGV